MCNLHNGQSINGLNEMGEHALPPQKSHRAYPSTSLKKTILPDIYFNKITKFIIVTINLLFLKLCSER